MENKMYLFDSHFTYQLIYDERTLENIYSNCLWRSFVRKYYGDFVDDNTGVITNIYDENIRIVKNRWKKSSRIKSRLIKMLTFSSKNNLYFSTFTFDDYYIGLPYLTLRTYVSKFLDKNFDSYVCNVDYGSLNGRLHFHAVVSCSRSPPDFPYGFKYYEKLFNDIDNLGIASNYLNKLTNHTTKEKGRVLYSKDLR